LPSDRLVAEWHLKSRRVRQALRGESPRPARKKPAAEAVIPGDMEFLKRARPAQAAAAQRAVREQLQTCFARKLAITGFVPEGPNARYLVDPYED